MAQLAALKPAQTVSHDRFAIELGHVRKSHGTSEVYTDLHFQLLRGTFVAMVGPIGSGKTTMINMFAGLERPDAGTIFVQGQDITKMDDDSLAAYRGKTVGLVPQVQTLIPELTAYENVELPLYFAKVDRDARRRRVDEVMARVGIRGEADRVVGTLSVGERQMVSFARALVSDPPILLLDEPTEALDPLMSEVVLGLLRGDNMTLGKTIFVTTHDRRVTALARRTLRVGKKIP
ncbi:MAG: ATP-binding cassette domain-containing protein [Thaumarchaeota archaeon]|nr:ATP-binding cassette domain-containing protein [Nitrososphaerota archaeon]